MDNKKPNTSMLWSKYKLSDDLEAKEELVLAYASLVKYIAGRLAIHLPPSVEFDDLVSYGTFGLLDAIDKFEPERGFKFETYAAMRIRGAILDGLRSTDWVPRSVRSKARELEQATQHLEHSLGRAPTHKEIAASLDISLDGYYNLVDEVKTTTIAYLDEIISHDDSGNEPIRLSDTVRDEEAVVDQGLIDEEMKKELAAAIDALPEREKLVISLYYYEGLTLKEIGYVLEVSESRVCQIHLKALSTLKAKLR